MTDMEQQIANAARDAIREAIKTTLASDYNSPLKKLVAEVVAGESGPLRALLREGLDSALGQEAFRAEVRAAFAHALARALMADFKGEIEKQAAALRQQPEFRARVVLAIERCVTEGAEPSR